MMRNWMMMALAACVLTLGGCGKKDLTGGPVTEEDRKKIQEEDQRVEEEERRASGGGAGKGKNGTVHWEP